MLLEVRETTRCLVVLPASIRILVSGLCTIVNMLILSDLQVGREISGKNLPANVGQKLITHTMIAHAGRIYIHAVKLGMDCELLYWLTAKWKMSCRFSVLVQLSRSGHLICPAVL